MSDCPVCGQPQPLGMRCLTHMGHPLPPVERDRLLDLLTDKIMVFEASIGDDPVARATALTVLNRMWGKEQG